MKTCKILTVAIAAAVLSGTSALAQFNYQNGDVIAAFGNGTAPDVIVDLGTVANYQSGSYNLSDDLSGVLNSTFSGVSGGLYWSVMSVNDTTLSPSASGVTQTDPNTVWATLARSNPAIQNDPQNVSGNSRSQHLAVLQIQTIANTTTPNQAPPGQIVDYAAGIEQVAVSLGGYSAEVNPSTDPLIGNLSGTWHDSILNTGAGTSDFYQNDPSADSAGYLGSFSLSSAGVLTFSPVPEPSTWVMIGTGGLALLALRRRK